jgi:hypothetical protein
MNNILKKSIFLFFLIFSLINLSCQSTPKESVDNIEKIFKSIGFVEFNLSETKSSLLKNDRITKEKHGDFEYYYLIKNDKIFDTEKNVTYTFIFNKGKLTSCSFEIKDKRFFFKKLRDYIVKNMESSFINSQSKSQYRFFEETKEYKKYFKTKYKGKDFYIIGGVDIGN